MTMTENETPAKPRKQRKASRTPRRASFHKPEKAPAAFPGLTDSDCAAACTAERCAISGLPVCGHPRKAYQTDGSPEALRRLKQAQKQLGMRAMERRYA